MPRAEKVSHVSKATGARQKSTYRAKQEAIEDGTREPFEFKDYPRADSGPRPGVPRKFPQSNVLIPVTQSIRATVTKIVFGHGYMFLLNDAGARIYCNMNVIKRDCPSARISKGSIIECGVEDHVIKGLRVTRIVTVHSPA